MKRVSLFASLVGALVLSLWLGNARPVAAAPVCDELDGNECFQEGQHLACIWANGWGWGSCSCTFGTWRCF